MSDAEKVRDAFKRIRLSQRQIADACGKHPSTISNILRGNWPHYGGGYVPEYLWKLLESWNLEVERTEP